MIDNTEGDYVAERIRASSLSVGGSSPVEALLANSLREGKPLADDGSLYDTIQGAENAASAFVFVPPGTFNESVTIDTPGLTLLGSGRATTINGGTIGEAVAITANNVTTKNASVESSSSHGINVTGSNSTVSNITVNQAGIYGINANGLNTTVNNCRVFSGDGGIAVRGGGTGSIVTNSIIDFSGVSSSNADGFNTFSCDDVIVSNLIVQNVPDFGIIIDSDDTVVIGSRIHNTGSDGIEIRSVNCIIANNRVSGAGTANIDDIGTGTVLDANLTGPAN